MGGLRSDMYCISIRVWHITQMQLLANVTMELPFQADVSSNLVKLEVFYETLNIEYIEESATYNVSETSDRELCEGYMK